MACVATVGGLFANPARAQNRSLDPCPRPAAGSVVPEPYELQSHDGVLKVEFTYRNYLDRRGQMRYCYVDAQGGRSSGAAFEARRPGGSQSEK